MIPVNSVISLRREKWRTKSWMGMFLLTSLFFIVKSYLFNLSEMQIKSTWWLRSIIEKVLLSHIFFITARWIALYFLDLFLFISIIFIIWSFFHFPHLFTLTHTFAIIAAEYDILLRTVHYLFTIFRILEWRFKLRMGRCAGRNFGARRF